MAIGGVIGYGDTLITDSKINNLEIELNNSKFSSVGALTGCAKDCTVSNITMNEIKMNCDVVGYTTYNGVTTAFSIGGVVGTINSKETWEHQTLPQITNVNIDGLEIKTNVSNIGGLVGCSNHDLIIAECNAKNATFESTESLTQLSETTQANYAGLVATQTPGTNLSISDSSVENLEISIEQGALAHAAGFVGVCGDVNISNSTVDGLKIANKSHTGLVGGITGVIVYAYNYDYVYSGGKETYKTKYLKGQYSDVSVSNFLANIAANGYNTKIGGILGYGSAIIKNSQVTNMQSEAEIDGYIEVGGIVGLAEKDSEIDNVTVNSTEDMQEEAVLYSSQGIAGGIAGKCLGKLSNATVENITVQTKRGIAIPGIDPDEINEELKEQGADTEGIIHLNNLYSTAIAAQYLEEFTNCIVRNVKVIYSNSTEIVNFEQ